MGIHCGQVGGLRAVMGAAWAGPAHLQPRQAGPRASLSRTVETCQRSPTNPSPASTRSGSDSGSKWAPTDSDDDVGAARPAARRGAWRRRRRCRGFGRATVGPVSSGGCGRSGWRACARVRDSSSSARAVRAERPRARKRGTPRSHVARAVCSVPYCLGASINRERVPIERSHG
jgi:hypothetical protein